MKGCPICNAKYQDNILVCEKCNIKLIDWRIAEKVYFYGYSSIMKQYPNEYNLIIDYLKANNNKKLHKNISEINNSNKPHTVQPSQPIPQNILTCPKCGSTAVTTGQRGFSIITGFLGSSQTMNRCGNCGYKWKPRG